MMLRSNGAAARTGADLRGRKRLARNTLHTWLWGYAFIAPLLLGILVFSIGPMLYAFYMSLTQWNGLTDPKFIGFANFGRLFSDPEIWNEFGNTLIYIAGVVPLTLLISLFIASLLNARIHFKSFFRVIFFLPMVTMPTAVATVWRWLLNSEYGVVNVFLRPLGLNPQWLGDPQYIMAAVIIVAVWSSVSYASVILLAGLQNIPQSYYEAAEIDGAGAWKKFTSLTVPLISPTLFFLLVTSTIGGFKAFDIIFTFSGAAGNSGGPVTDAIRTMVYGIYQRGFTFMEMGYAASEAAILFVFIMLVTALQFYLQKKLVFYD